MFGCITSISNRTGKRKQYLLQTFCYRMICKIYNNWQIWETDIGCKIKHALLLLYTNASTIGINNKIAMMSYKVIFCLFVIVGSAVSIDNVVKLSDAMIFAMVIPNMIGIYILLPKVKEEIISYEKHVKEIDEQA